MAQKALITIGIVGSGRMGTDIFYYLSEFDFPLIWLCISDPERDAVAASFRKKVDRRVRTGLISEAERNTLLDKTRISCVLSDLAPADLVIETIPEDAGAKSALFKELESIVSSEAVITTNTSSIRPSLLVDTWMRRERYAGLHFFYPVKLKNIAEIIVTDHTNEKSRELIGSFLRAIEKFHIRMHERNGFVLNRIFLDLQAQAWRYYEQGTAGMKCIDSIVKTDLFPSGVFELFDTIGLDVVCPSVKRYAEYAGNTPFYEPLIHELDRLVSCGKLGCKSGEGFYRDGDRETKDAVACEEPVRREISSVLRSVYINSACRALEEQICSRDELENALKEYTGAETGPFAMIDKTGPAPVRELLSARFAVTGFNAYKPSGMLNGHDHSAARERS